MKIWGSTFLIILAFTLSAKSEIVIAKNILVKGHGGQFYGDIVAEKEIRENNLQIYEGLSLKTKFGETYLLIEDEESSRRHAALEAILCELGAPRGWHNETHPNHNKSRGQAVHCSRDKFPGPRPGE